MKREIILTRSNPGLLPQLLRSTAKNRLFFDNDAAGQARTGIPGCFPSTSDPRRRTDLIAKTAMAQGLPL